MRGWMVVAVVIGLSVVVDAEARADAKAKPRGKAHAKAEVAAAPEPLVVSETKVAPGVDYQAETYSGVPLDAPYAKERGFAKGLVYMVFERQRRAAFRIGHDRINKLVRLVEATQPSVVLAKGTTASTRVDVLDTKDGIVVVETVTTNAGIFTTSDVYVFPRSASPAQRSGALDGVAPASRDRIRTALSLALR